MKPLTHKEYPVKPFNLQLHIKKLVDREAEYLIEIEQPPLPKYEKQSIKWTETVKRAFADSIKLFSI